MLHGIGPAADVSHCTSVYTPMQFRRVGCPCPLKKMAVGRVCRHALLRRIHAQPLHHTSNLGLTGFPEIF
jgi:hypothetical protein